MKTRPASPSQGTLFEFDTTCRELRAEEQYAREGQASRTLIRAADLRVVLVAQEAGKTSSEHHAKVTAKVQTLSGHIHLQLPGRAVDVPAGQVLLMEAGLAHDVYAESDTAFLPTLEWPAPK